MFAPLNSNLEDTDICRVYIYIYRSLKKKQKKLKSLHGINENNVEAKNKISLRMFENHAGAVNGVLEFVRIG